MTFADFNSFAEWCIDNEFINVEEYDEHERKIIIRDLWDTQGMYVCEVLTLAYGSGFCLGPMLQDEFNGCIVLYED